MMSKLSGQSTGDGIHVSSEHVRIYFQLTKEYLCTIYCSLIAFMYIYRNVYVVLF